MTVQPAASAPRPLPRLRDDPAAAVLALRGVHKRWPGHSRSVLEGVDLALAPGETTHLTGRNGAGKTTLLRIAGGLIRPDAGAVELAGLSPERERRAFQRRVGFLSAGSGGLYARLSARRHLALTTRLCLLASHERASAIEAAIERFSLAGILDRRADRLSTGERQRVRLALAFVHDPDVVLLDEPRSSLDGDGVQLLAAAIARTCERGGSVVWCSPSQDPPAAPCSSAWFLEDGALRATPTLMEVRR
jgi:ABC-type multidrug transport system ATPase subunit